MSSKPSGSGSGLSATWAGKCTTTLVINTVENNRP
ncbi:Uncharacterised protein [Vibrio cholerae]|nr:Uncharacterised protein [Vibrio cholerae]